MSKSTSTITLPVATMTGSSPSVNSDTGTCIRALSSDLRTKTAAYLGAAGTVTVTKPETTLKWLSCVREKRAMDAIRLILSVLPGLPGKPMKPTAIILPSAELLIYIESFTASRGNSKVISSPIGSSSPTLFSSFNSLHF